ncbi:MAG: AMIN domain-containing protein, partial [Myxococcota bacterium]|nr:AMIN domain-containing protein [Myxococcota bacterium]
MRRNHPVIVIAALLIAAALGAPAHAKGAPEIRAVEFDDTAEVTRVHLRGARSLAFTVYKLERPSRVVIDVPRARLAEKLGGHESGAVFATNTWAVSTIAAQQVDDGGDLVRVIVTLARPGRYDVKTIGDDLVVIVTARDGAPAKAAPGGADVLAKSRAESEEAKR